MVRRALPADLDQLTALRSEIFEESADQSRRWFEQIVGLDNVLIAFGENRPAAVLCTLPVRYKQQKGILFYSVMTLPKWRGRGLMTKLMMSCLRAFAASGEAFAVAAPGSAALAGWLKKLGFQGAFPMRVVERSIEPNLWAQAEFDNMTVAQLLEARGHYQPGVIGPAPEAMAGVVAELYSRGITLVSNPRGYGLYYQAKNILQFVELQAENDHSADVLLQAAREKTGADRAVMSLAERQSLYLGEGHRCGYGMIRFLAKPFSISDAYFRMLLGSYGRTNQ
jgi:GNAT superfamily N-acetyltransferase